MKPLKPGPLNLITDVEGLAVGNADDASRLTGVTVVVPDGIAVAAVEQRGGAPGTRELDALKPSTLVDGVHAVVLSGGSVFGLDAASGVVTALSKRGVGFVFGAQPHPCPVVPSAILFDLMNGGDKAWDEPPYHALGVAALAAASKRFALGNSGAGMGATAGAFKGGLGSASVIVGRHTVGALVAVNCFGSVVDPRTGRLWAEPFLLREDGPAPHVAVEHDAGMDLHPVIWGHTKGSRAAAAAQNTTIAVVATDAILSKADAHRFAIMAADGLPRAIRPVHTPFDGDTVIALATGRHPLGLPAPLSLATLGTAAADTLARAVARAVLAADSIPGWRSIASHVS
ncbi:MAG: P1 family peptidase [Hyphomicrobiales bacterium]